VRTAEVTAENRVWEAFCTAWRAEERAKKARGALGSSSKASGTGAAQDYGTWAVTAPQRETLRSTAGTAPTTGAVPGRPA
jgi:hypothetical protein